MQSAPLHLYCDARSVPPRIAAVLCEKGQPTQWADMQPSEKVLACFRKGGDKQIMSLELLSIALGKFITFLQIAHCCALSLLWQGCRYFPPSFRTGTLSYIRTILERKVPRARCIRFSFCSSVSFTALILLLQGAAKRFDQSALVHCIWKVLATTKTGAYIKRVPTLENIADLPSRFGGRSTFTRSAAGNSYLHPGSATVFWQSCARNGEAVH